MTGMKVKSLKFANSSPLFFASVTEKINALKAKGEDVIRLDIGSPDLPPADFIIETLRRSAGLADHHGYQPHLGYPALRQAWAEMYRRVHGVELDPDREVLPLLGSKEGIFHLPMALIDPGDVVLVPDPGYVTYTQGALYAGGKPYPFPLLPEHGFLPDLAAIPEDILRQAKIIWLNYPNNPTAATANPEFFEEVVRFAARYDLLVCHDAAYTQVNFDDYRSPSLLQVPGAMEVAVEFNTLSKSHNMAGWRLGVVAGNREVLRSLYTLKTNLDSGHFLPVLEAATAAMTGDQSWLDKRNRVYQERRDLVLRTLQGLGLVARTPKASLYVWFAVPSGWDSVGFANMILERAAVSLTPGTVFGKQGEGFIRLSFTDSTERVAEAMQRITEIMGRPR